MNDKGSATILALLVSAVMITVAIGFNWLVKEHLKAAEGLKAKTEAMLEARSALDSLLYSLLTSQLTQREIILPAGANLLGVQRIRLGGDGIKLANGVAVKIQDSSGLISLVNPDVEVLRRLAQIVGVAAESLGTLGDSLMDWVDVDDLSHINGAESSYYRLEGKPFGARNYPIQYKDELSFIKGWGPDLYAKIEPYVTLLPTLGFNPNTADDIVLMAHLDIDKSTVENLKSYLTQKPISSQAEIFALTGRLLKQQDLGVYFFPSPFFEITVKVGNPRTLYSLQAGVDLREKVTSPFSVVYWREG